MTVVQPNSIAGINSITVQSGNALNLHKADGSLIRTLVAESGISTYTSISVGSAVTDNSANNSINIGLGASISNASNNVLTFGTNGDDRVTIDASGNSKFISNSQQVIIQNGGTSGQPEIAFRNSADDGDAYGNIDGATLTFRTGGTSRFNINSSGQIGIGTVTPDVLLHLGADSATAQLKMQRTNAASNGNDYGRIYWESYSGTLTGQISVARESAENDGYMIFKTASSGTLGERLRITNAGDVLIGRQSTSTSHTLCVQADSVAEAIAVIGRSADDISEIGFFENDTTTRLGEVQYRQDHVNFRHRVGDIRFCTAGSAEKMRIDTSGRLLIGHTTSEAMFYTGNLQVQGTNSTTSAITVKSNQNDSGGPAIVLGKSRGGAVGGTTVVQDGDELGCIYFNGADGTDTVSRGAAIRGSVDGTPGSNDMPGRLQFFTTADGAAAVTERLRIDSSGRVLIGTTVEGSSGADELTINTASGHGGITIRNDTSSNGNIWFSDGTSGAAEYAGYVQYAHNDDHMVFGTNGSERLRIDSSGRLLVGSNASPSAVTGSDSQYAYLQIEGNSYGANTPGYLVLANAAGISEGTPIGRIMFTGTGAEEYARIEGEGDGATGSNDYPGRLSFYTTADGAATTTERLRITSAGRLLYGNHLNDRGAELQYEGDQHACIGIHRNSNTHGAPAIILSASRGTSAGSNTVVQSGDYLGMITFKGTDGSDLANGAYITGIVDGTPGSDDMPARLGFWTSPDGSQTPAERLRIQADGHVLVGKTTTSIGTEGVTILGSGEIWITKDGSIPLSLNRGTNDGELVRFHQGGTNEGNISVSGSTISYNGGHLSRWSQLVGISTNVKSDRPTIYQGTVMSNLDAMCEWSGETNQQLNKTKVSDTVSDKDVAGVFWAWDDGDDEYTNDFYVAMTGDMVIRVAGSTTVARGDLLESAGDGTAKPQSDDIVRSKTIAKITSTISTATYADGSKAYPCVLMAC